MGLSLLQKIVEHYLHSRDFNGLPLREIEHNARPELISLLKTQFVECVFEDDWMNPHIRPWHSKRTADEQISLLMENDEYNHGCVYPLEIATSDFIDVQQFVDRPYQLKLAKGGTTLGLEFFEFSVLETYLNDPRYLFEFGDFSAFMCVSDDAFENLDHPEKDKISLSQIGFAYNFKELSSESRSLKRFVAVFLGDLAKLSPEHQGRWSSYSLQDRADVSAHPVWFNSQMGRWPDGTGPFELFLSLISEINKLTLNEENVSLFRTSLRDRKFGWIVRPTDREWYQFVHLLDKYLSENLNDEFFQKIVGLDLLTPEKKIGSLRKLERYMQLRGLEGTACSNIIGPLKEVRRLRGLPAHEFQNDAYDEKLIIAQIDLMQEVNGSLQQFLAWISTSPMNVNYAPPNWGNRYRV